jgi:trehalose 6-phosphate phosphatase
LSAAALPGVQDTAASAPPPQANASPHPSVPDHQCLLIGRQRNGAEDQNKARATNARLIFESPGTFFDDFVKNGRACGRRTDRMTRPPPLLHLQHALFLDLDGTLAPIEATPDAVVFQPDRAALLDRVERAMAGGLAILSGRTVAEIDRVLGPGRTMGAVHGLVRRRADGAVIGFAASPRIDEARRALRTLAADHAGLIFEDKQLSLALHYRLAPEQGAMVRAAVDQIARATGLAQQAGEMVCELRTPGPDKGDALKAFMAEAPFAGRTPIAVGDDLTDEHAFRVADALGGFGILVGAPRPTVARYRLNGVPAVLDWLRASLKETT